MTRYAVFIHGRQYNTSADSPEAAVRDAMETCVRPWWKGPLWNARTVFEVHEIYGADRWTIKASDV